MNKGSSSTHFPSKRLAENMEVAPAAKKQALEMSMGSPKSSSPVRMGVLSRESSFKNIEKERVRPAQQTSLGNHSANDMLETSRPSTAGPRLQTPKGEQMIPFASCHVVFCVFLPSLFCLFPLLACNWFAHLNVFLESLRYFYPPFDSHNSLCFLCRDIAEVEFI